MKKIILKSFGYAIISTLFSGLSYADNAQENKDFSQIVIAPSCLLKNQPISYTVLGHKANLFLIEAKNNDLLRIRESGVRSDCGQYLDVSYTWFKLNKNVTNHVVKNKLAVNLLTNELKSTFQTQSQLTNKKFTLSNSEQVEELLTHFSSQEMWERLLKLTSFKNRFANSQYGVDAANWIQQYATELAENVGRKDITTEQIKTGFFFQQPSIVVKVPGVNAKLPAVLVSGHMDTTNGDKPGADDDGSGSSTALEVMRAVLSSGKKFERTMYFVWYAAEEQGLVGSSYVVRNFKNKNIALEAVLHFDMTGYQETPENKIYMLNDFVDSELTNFVADLARTYVKTEVGTTRCGYACSDHASWTRKGYRAAATFESDFSNSSPYIHLATDTPDKISIEHMSRFAKVGIAFIGELANPM